MDRTLRLLIVDDIQDDADLILLAMQRGGFAVTYELVDTLPAMHAALERQEWDVITSDHSMPRFSAPEALALAKARRPDIPFIIVSGEIDLGLAVTLMRDGAWDYVQKHQLAHLVPAIERVLRDVMRRNEQLPLTPDSDPTIMDNYVAPPIPPTSSNHPVPPARTE